MADTGTDTNQNKKRRANGDIILSATTEANPPQKSPP